MDSIKNILISPYLDVHTVCHVVDDMTTVEMVRQGFGFAIMPLLTMNNLSEGVKMLRIVPHENRVIGVAVLNEANLSPAVKKCFHFIQNYDFAPVLFP